MKRYTQLWKISGFGGGLSQVNAELELKRFTSDTHQEVMRARV